MSNKSKPGKISQGELRVLLNLLNNPKVVIHMIRFSGLLWYSHLAHQPEIKDKIYQKTLWRLLRPG